MDTLIGLHTMDSQTIGHVLEVVYKGGRVMLPDNVTDTWLLHVQPARDRHEQNVETYRDVKGRLFLRFLRHVNKGEQLLVWYSDDLARQSGIPILSPDNIRGNQQYMCTECQKIFKYPNSLKAHIRFRCSEKKPDVTDRIHPTPMFTVRSILNLPLTGDAPQCASLPSMGAFLTSSSKSGASKDSLENWLLTRATAQLQLPTAELSAFRPHYKAGDVKADPDRGEASHTDQGVLNLSVREAPKHPPPQQTQTSMSGVSQPIQIFNHIHPPAFPIAIDHSALRLYYPYLDPMHEQTRLCCGSLPTHTSLTEQRGACMSQYGRHLLRATSNAKHAGQAISSQCYQGNIAEPLTGKGSVSSMPFPFPMPSDTEGEPLDLIPRSLFTSKSRKGHLCIYCGKLYSRKYGLKIHLRTHTGYKPLKCKVCLRPFGDPSNLNKHVRLHAEGETPYRCEFCGKVLVRRRDLERHIRSRHPDKAEKQLEDKVLSDGEHADTTTVDTADTCDVMDREIVVT
ncbi:zinc finger protein 235-like [Haliotis rufescens]|uniref:zinc finger protein 235-like n=1 Tax=Haliotis rufescens TaxID=6454 RepID=UPI001EB0140F|nr:zinc finger protein 235-like [Haliotis rufescens]